MTSSGSSAASCGDLRSPREVYALGVVLAGGAARRLPGKPLLELDGRTLIDAPLNALRGVLRDVVIVAKRPLAGYDTLIEPAQPQHPSCGILHALRHAAGRPVLVCAADMPWIDAAELRAILAARARGGPAAVVPRAGGLLQPLCALYEQAALARLIDAHGPMREIVATMAPRVIDRPARPYTNVNTPAQLAALRQPNVNE